MSTRCGCRRSTCRPRPTRATTWPTTATSTRSSVDLDAADEMIRVAADVGLRVIVDLVPNHTSDEHDWFAEALAAGPGSPERARYLFRDGKGPDGSEAAEQLAVRLRWWRLGARHRGGRDARPVVPAPVRPQAARPRLGQPRGRRRVPRRAAVLARPRGGRVPGRRRPRPREGERAARLGRAARAPARHRGRREPAADVGPGGRARHLPRLAARARRVRRRPHAGGRGVGRARRAARAVRAVRRDAPGLQLRLPGGRMACRRPATGDRAQPAQQRRGGRADHLGAEQPRRHPSRDPPRPARRRASSRTASVPRTRSPTPSWVCDAPVPPAS